MKKITLLSILCMFLTIPIAVGQSSFKHADGAIGTHNNTVINGIAGSASAANGYMPSLAPITITQSTTQNIVPLNSVSCPSGDDSFFRDFDLSSDGITDDFEVSAVEFGVEDYTGSLTVTVNIYSMAAGTFPGSYPGSATLQGSASVALTTADAGTVVSLPLTATIPSGQHLIYELFAPDFTSGGNFYPGSNPDGQSGLSYLQSAPCGADDPTDVSLLGFPDMHLVFNVVGEEASGGGPITYCGPLDFSTVEPITYVEVADISNRTAASSTTAHEDFTAIVGNVEQGTSYPITFEGNTNGNYTNRFYVFIDWNQNGILNDPGEVYIIPEYLVNSTGIDGKQVFGSIEVPADAVLGNTRMRVKKTYGSTTYDNPCLRQTSYGQAEDYTINVQAGGAPITYCTASGNSTTFEHITNVTYAGINNTTTTHSGYNDFTAQVANVSQGETNQISVTIKADGSDYVYAFIDWNQNGVLDDAGEVYTLATSTSNNGPHSMNITVPIGAELGETRMRVKVGWNQSTPDPCGTFSYGEIEDYTVNVNTPPIGSPPVIACPADIVINNEAGTCGAVANFAGVAFDEEDGNISGDIIATPASGSIFAVGDTTVELSVTDSDGNTATCEFTVTVVDNEDPIAVCQNVTVDLDASGSYTLTPAEIDNGSSDNCGIATYELASMDASTSSLTTTFAGGNALAGSMFDLEAINDLTIDSFDVNMPTGETADVEVYFKTGTWVGSESTPGDWALVGTATDITSAGVGEPTPLNLDLGINVTDGERVAFYITRTSGSLTYTNGTTVGALFASDSNLQMFEGAGKGYPFGSTFQPRNFNGNIIYSTDGVLTPISGALDCSNVGTNDIYLLITDNSGNTSSCLATVTVQDVTAPEIVCVAGLDVFLDADGNASIDPMDLVTSVDEACGYTITAGGGTGGGGSGSLTTTFDSNNGGSAGWTVMYDLTVGPNDIEITDLDVNTDATIAFNLDLYTLEGTYVGNESNPGAWGAPVTTGSGTGAGLDNPSNAVLAAPVTLSANTTYGIAIVMDVKPKYTNGTGCPGNQCYDNDDISLSLGTAVAGFFTGSVFPDRVWNGTINYTIDGGGSGLEFTCADLGENMIEVTVTDDSGNIATCMAIVNVIDNIAPVIVCQEATIELGADGTTTIDPYDLISDVIEACGLSSVAVDVPTVTCADIGTPITVTVFASDASGNIASCTTVITVVDNLAPAITCPADQTVDPGIGNLFYIVPDYFATGEATAIDNCTSPVTITTQDPAPGDAIPDGVYTVTLTATDEYGNTSTCDFELTVDTVIGVADNSLDKGLTLYPNPAKHVVNLVNKTNIALEKMMIYDINGKLVNQVNLRTMQGEKAVDVSSLAAGVYVVQIIGDNASTVKRLIKE